MAAPREKTIRPSFIAAGIMMLILMMPHAGFMLILAALPLLLWLFYSAYIILQRPEQKQLQIKRVLIWISAVAITLIVHIIYHQRARNNAEEIVAAVKNYWATHGHCPATMKDIRYDRAQFSAKLGFSYYGCEDGKPSLFYAATFIPFDTYHYDFSTGVWNYRE